MFSFGIRLIPVGIMFKFEISPGSPVRSRDNVQNRNGHRNSPPGRLPRNEVLSLVGNKPGGLL